MSCLAYARLLSDHIDDCLSPRDHARLLEHVSVCSRCAARLARYRQLDVMLRRLPETVPSPEVRERVLLGAAMTKRHGFWHRSRMLTAAAAMIVLAVGMIVPGASRFHRLPASEQIPVLAQISGGSPVSIDSRASTAAEANQEDVVFLREMGRTVERTGFYVVMPEYLPRGWHVDRVQIGKVQPAEPIDQMEVAFVANGEQLRIWQLRGAAVDARRKQVPPEQWRQARRVLVSGREWLYVIRNLANGPEQAGILVGQRDGVMIWLESSLPMDEMAKVAASLQN